MTDEDESTDSGIIAAERATLKFLRGREANDAAQEDRGTCTVNQLAQHLVLLPADRPRTLPSVVHPQQEAPKASG